MQEWWVEAVDHSKYRTKLNTAHLWSVNPNTVTLGRLNLSQIHLWEQNSKFSSSPEHCPFCIITSGAQRWSIACFVCSNLLYIYENILWLCQPLCIRHIEANPPHEWREHNTATHTRTHTQTWEPVQMYSVSTVEAQWVSAFFGDSCSNYMFIDNCVLVESSGCTPG